MSNNPIEKFFLEIGHRNRCGIYMIQNIKSGKVYVGQSVNIRRRLGVHRRDLNANEHVNQHLQNSWNKHSEKSFSFLVLEECSQEKLLEREIFWIKKSRSFNNSYGYNYMHPGDDSKSLIHAGESIRRMKGSMRKYSDEELISYLQEFYYMEGRIYSCKDAEDERFQNYPKKHCYDTVFGSFENALKAADLTDFDENRKLRRRRHHTKESIIGQYSRFMEEFGRFPNHKERQDTTVYDLPTINAIIKVFGGMKELREEMGYSLEYQKELERKESLVNLREEYEKHGFLTYELVDSKHSSCRSTRYYVDNFGSLDKAYEAAGINVEENNLRKAQARRRKSKQKGGK